MILLGVFIDLLRVSIDPCQLINCFFNSKVLPWGYYCRDELICMQL